MTASSSQGTLLRRARAVTVASRIGQSTGALLILAGPPARPGHRSGARAGLAGVPAGRGPKSYDPGRRRPGN